MKGLTKYFWVLLIMPGMAVAADSNRANGNGLDLRNGSPDLNFGAGLLTAVATAGFDDLLLRPEHERLKAELARVAKLDADLAAKKYTARFTPYVKSATRGITALRIFNGATGVVGVGLASHGVHSYVTSSKDVKHASGNTIRIEVRPRSDADDAR